MPNKHRIVLLENGKLKEYHEGLKHKPYAVGDIYLGKVESHFPNLNAVFVNIGDERHAFLNYLDLGPYFKSQQAFLAEVSSNNRKVSNLDKIELETPLAKEGSITKVLKKGDKVLVQVNKEAIANKAIRLCGNMTLTGRYLIVLPWNKGISISRRITNAEERARLQRIVASIIPANFGVIIRTIAQGKKISFLTQDLKDLLQRWQEGIQKLPHAKPGQKIIAEMERASSVLRDVLNEGFDQIIADNPTTYEAIKRYVAKAMPDKEGIVNLYQGNTNILEHFGVEVQLKTAFAKVVPLKEGGYLIIEPTEAMHVIDVNSGKYSTQNEDQEKSALRINLEAAKAIANLIPLRGLSGIIAIDFISLNQATSKQILYETMRQYMKEDRARVAVFRLTKVGVMHITRERRRPVPHIGTHEKCPTCHGKGSIGPSLSIVKHIEGQLHMLLKHEKVTGLTLRVHPYVHAYLTKGLFSKRWLWLWRYWQHISIQEDQKMAVTDFRFTNAKRRVMAQAPRLRR